MAGPVERKSDKRIVLWRWAKPTRMFRPTENPYWVNVGKKFKSHNKAVRAAFNPIDWIELMSGEGKILHKIVLNRKQTELCVVTEGSFRPKEKEITEFTEKMSITLIGSLRRYEEENYETSFVPLLKYSGGYNLPEVLIPFPVKAEIISYAKILILVWKLKTWLAHVRAALKRILILISVVRFFRLPI